MPHPLAATVQGKIVREVAHFDSLHIGESKVSAAVDARDGYQYVLVEEGVHG